ncbi:hypothetical protein HY497_01280 [Candidatus Woesearchaeota archaeon]|nr:hypothetical protein [Candidatus Woesearchaeota archaeon]
MVWETAQTMTDDVVARLRSQVPEIEKLEKLVPAAYHEALKKVTLRRALRLYGDKPEVLAEELRLVRACIPKGEADFGTLLEGAFVETPLEFTYKPRLALCTLESKMSVKPLSKHAYGVHAVDSTELLQYFRHGGVFPHYRDGKWRIEVIPHQRCFTGSNKQGNPPEECSQAASIDEAFIYNDVEQTKRLLHRLSKDEAEILRMRYGLDGSKPMDFTEIGDHFVVSSTTASTRYRRALGKLYQLMTGHGVNEANKEKEGNPAIDGKCTSARAYQRDQRYADQHGFVGYLAANRIIRRMRDDHFGRHKPEQADELYRNCVKHFLEGDGQSHKKLKEYLTEKLGEEVGSRLFREAMQAKGVRIEFNRQILPYFEAAGDGGSLAFDHNALLPLDAVHSIHFNGGQRQAREFRKVLVQPAPPRSIFRMYLT